MEDRNVFLSSSCIVHHITQATNTPKQRVPRCLPTASTCSASSTTMERRAFGYATWRLAATSACIRVSQIDPSIAHAHTPGRILLSPELAGSESLQNLFANIRRQSDFRLRTCDLCNRLAYASVYRGCQKGVDLARIRPAEYRCHARDLSAPVDRVRHGCVEVGTCGKQSVKVGHHAVLVDEGMGPVAILKLSAPHHLALIVNAFSEREKISRQSVEACDSVVLPLVLPKSAIGGCAVRAKDLPNNLALVVNGDALTGARNSEVRKRDGSAVFPNYGVIR